MKEITLRKSKDKYKLREGWRLTTYITHKVLISLKRGLMILENCANDIIHRKRKANASNI